MFGTVAFRSARIVSCRCEPQYYLEVAYSLIDSYIPEQATPELHALQAKLSALVPYRQVVETLREFLPVGETLNRVTVRNRHDDRVPGKSRFAVLHAIHERLTGLANPGSAIRNSRIRYLGQADERPLFAIALPDFT